MVLSHMYVLSSASHPVADELVQTVMDMQGCARKIRQEFDLL